ncbi:MAG: hypothetical protein EBR09_16285 [Proteobacteria bacterium]|nr:hypothetical protein [Pseudomonadota bacterium]
MGEEGSAQLCKLCEYAGNDDYKFQEIINFVHEHSHEAHIDGLCAQVQRQLREEFALEMSVEELRTHFLNHKCDQKTVLNNVIRELVPMISVLKQGCSMTQDGTTIVDPKALNMYLDSVKQVMSLFKHLETMRQSGRRV